MKYPLQLSTLPNLSKKEIWQILQQSTRGRVSVTAGGLEENSDFSRHCSAIAFVLLRIIWLARVFPTLPSVTTDRKWREKRAVEHGDSSANFQRGGKRNSILQCSRQVTTNFLLFLFKGKTLRLTTYHTVHFSQIDVPPLNLYPVLGIQVFEVQIT